MLQGERVRLRLVREADLDRLHDFHQDISNRGQFFPVGVVSLPTFSDQFRKSGFWEKSERHADHRRRSYDSILGHIEFFETVNYLDEIELSYIIYSPDDHTGRGLATEAVTLLWGYLFEAQKVNRIRLVIHPDNHASRRVAEKPWIHLRGCGPRCLVSPGPQQRRRGVVAPPSRARRRPPGRHQQLVLTPANRRRSTISRTTLTLPAAGWARTPHFRLLPGCSGLPDPSCRRDCRRTCGVGSSTGVANPLPYPVQSGYERQLRLTDVPALRLGNDRLEALVPPQLGGRVWALRDRATGGTGLREPEPDLREPGSDGGRVRRRHRVEPRIDRPCWTTGGGVRRRDRDRPRAASAVEWERTRDLVFQVDLMVPEMPVLLAFVRVRNPDGVPKPRTGGPTWPPPSGRAFGLAPATRAWRTGYDGSLASVQMPFPDSADTDVSDPLRSRRAADYFFTILAERRAWIAAVEADGRGVVQTATEAMPVGSCSCGEPRPAGGGGRKAGGGEARYLEIQAGLATTQLEHLRIDARGEVSRV